MIYSRKIWIANNKFIRNLILTYIMSVGVLHTTKNTWNYYTCKLSGIHYDSIKLISSLVKDHFVNDNQYERYFEWIYYES